MRNSSNKPNKSTNIDKTKDTKIKTQQLKPVNDMKSLNQTKHSNNFNKKGKVIPQLDNDNISKIISKDLTESNISETNVIINENLSKATKKTNKSMIIKDDTKDLENMKSILIQYHFVNTMLEDTYEKQKKQANDTLMTKISDLAKLRENNFNLISKFNNINNITKIEDNFTSHYTKVFNLQSKINQVNENANDFKLNFNYGLDKLYLEDNIVCDELGLYSNLEKGIKCIDELYKSNQDKFQNVEDLRKKISDFYKLLSYEKNLSFEINELLDNYENNLLETNMLKIRSILLEENESLEKELIK